MDVIAALLPLIERLVIALICLNYYTMYYFNHTDDKELEKRGKVSEKEAAKNMERNKSANTERRREI